MVFSSVLFLFFYLPIVLGVYYITPLKYRNLVLLVVNLFFYGWGEPIYIVIMFLSIIIDYMNGYYVAKYVDKNKAKAKLFVICSVVLNLSLLAFFKYYDFFALNISSLLGYELLKPLGLSLPIGISFYTFQTMSYTIDIYRKQAKAQKSMVAFGTYVTLFPQLIAGPIVRYNDVDDQLVSRTHSVDEFSYGIQRFIIGLAKKVLLANSIGQLWDTVIASGVSNLSVLGAWLGILAFAFQIYFDFSGYSDMAIGLGKMLGFTFLENFNYPYIAKSITDFWRRWHISLSIWFKEYVYIPLGGNRHGMLRTIINISIVWALTGFWHGASWNFLWWGVYFGFILIMEKLFLLKLLKRCPSFIQHGYTLILVLISWVLFAILDPTIMVEYLKIMFNLTGASLYNSTSLYQLANYAILFVILFIAATPLAKHLYNQWLMIERFSYLIPVVVLMLLVICTMYIVDASYNPFLYFRF